jgi:hypothetical protein
VPKLNRDVEIKLQEDRPAKIRIKKGTLCVIEDHEFGDVEISIPRNNGIELVLTIPDYWVDEGE